MNYNDFLKHSYSIGDGAPNAGNAVLLLGNANTLNADYQVNGWTNPLDLMRYLNGQTDNTIVGMFYHNKEDNYNLIVNNKVDFIHFENTLVGDITGIHINMANFYVNGSYPYPLEDGGNLLSNYYFNTYKEYTSPLLASSFDITLTGSKQSVYDFTNTTSGASYREDAEIVASGDAYYYHIFNIEGNVTNLQIGYGTPFNDEYDTGYTVGYRSGENKGYRDGYNDGIEIGQTLGGVDANTYNAFGYIGQTFQSISSIMEIEVLPHITLGLCFSIPFVLVMIMVLFRMLKK